MRAKSDSACRNKRKDKRLQVRVGHGGTLDPMATGVLIIGVGKGTKQLQQFLECKKVYDATVLFGAATDTYDVQGKVLARASYAHVTEELVRDSLDVFRGKIMQRPPIYSALRIQGKKLYEYAREGKEVPVEIKERPVEVTTLEITQWLDSKDHDHRLPLEEAEEEAKNIAQEALKLQDDADTAGPHSKSMDESLNSLISKKRKRLSGEDDDLVRTKLSKSQREEDNLSFTMSGALQSLPPQEPKASSDLQQESVLCETDSTQTRAEEDGPPAVKLRMIVSSGFYVRSFSHDLGKKVGCLAIMSDLVRVRQGDFKLGYNVLEYNDLAKGEHVWAPQVERMLDEWNKNASSLRESYSVDEC